MRLALILTAACVSSLALAPGPKVSRGSATLSAVSTVSVCESGIELKHGGGAHSDIASPIDGPATCVSGETHSLRLLETKNIENPVANTDEATNTVIQRYAMAIDNSLGEAVRGVNIAVDAVGLSMGVCFVESTGDDLVPKTIEADHPAGFCMGLPLASGEAAEAHDDHRKGAKRRTRRARAAEEDDHDHGHEDGDHGSAPHIESFTFPPTGAVATADAAFHVCEDAADGEMTGCDDCVLTATLADKECDATIDTERTTIAATPETSAYRTDELVWSINIACPAGASGTSTGLFTLFKNDGADSRATTVAIEVTCTGPKGPKLSCAAPPLPLADTFLTTHEVAPEGLKITALQCVRSTKTAAERELGSAFVLHDPTSEVLEGLGAQCITVGTAGACDVTQYGNPVQSGLVAGWSDGVTATGTAAATVGTVQVIQFYISADAAGVARARKIVQHIRAGFLEAKLPADAHGADVHLEEVTVPTIDPLAQIECRLRKADGTNAPCPSLVDGGLTATVVATERSATANSVTATGQCAVFNPDAEKGPSGEAVCCTIGDASSCSGTIVHEGIAIPCSIVQCQVGAFATTAPAAFRSYRYVFALPPSSFGPVVAVPLPFATSASADAVASASVSVPLEAGHSEDDGHGHRRRARTVQTSEALCAQVGVILSATATGAQARSERIRCADKLTERIACYGKHLDEHHPLATIGRDVHGRLIFTTAGASAASASGTLTTVQYTDAGEPIGDGPWLVRECEDSSSSKKGLLGLLGLLALIPLCLICICLIALCLCLRKPKTQPMAIPTFESVAPYGMPATSFAHPAVVAHWPSTMPSIPPVDPTYSGMRTIY